MNSLAAYSKTTITIGLPMVMATQKGNRIRVNPLTLPNQRPTLISSITLNTTFVFRQPQKSYKHITHADKKTIQNKISFTSLE